MTPELAVLKGEGVRVNRLAFSADGSRLAAAMNGWVEKNGKTVAVPGKANVWDVDNQRQVCVCNGPKADFTHVWMSADGKTVVTADNGMTNLNPVYHEWSALIAIGTRGYQAWDATTGKAIGSVIAPQSTASFTAAAVSPDGRYLAAVFNEILPGAASNPGPEYRPGRVDPSKPTCNGRSSRLGFARKKVEMETRRGTTYRSDFVVRLAGVLAGRYAIGRISLSWGRCVRCASPTLYRPPQRAFQTTEDAESSSPAVPRPR